MRDARDAFDAAGQSAAGAIVDSLGDPGSLAVDVATATRRRRRRTTLRTGTACVALVAAAASALTLRPEPPIPAGVSADGTVRELANMASAWNGDEWCQPSTDPEPYLPWGERGVSIASDAVRDADIRVEGGIFTMNEDTGKFEPVLFEQGDVIVNESTTFNFGEDAHFVALDVSWAGDALFQVEAGAGLEATGRAVSPLSGWPSDLTQGWGSSAAAQLPRYDPATDRSSVTYVSQLIPYCLSDDPTMEGMDSFLAPTIPADIRTAVQVRAEDGAPLATFIDAAGLDGTSLLFQGYADLNDTLELVPPTEDEVADAMERRDARPTVPPTQSLAAQVRDAVESDGRPLAEVRAGARLVARCQEMAAELETFGADLPVIPATADLEEVAWLSVFPDELPTSGLRSGTIWSTPDPAVDAETSEWGFTRLHLYLMNSGGELVAQAPMDVEWTQGDDGVLNEVSRISSYGSGTAECESLGDLEAGTYRAFATDEWEAGTIFDYASQPLASEALGIMVAWYDLGEITVVG